MEETQPWGRIFCQVEFRTGSKHLLSSKATLGSKMLLHFTSPNDGLQNPAEAAAARLFSLYAIEKQTLNWRMQNKFAQRLNKIPGLKECRGCRAPWNEIDWNFWSEYFLFLWSYKSGHWIADVGPKFGGALNQSKLAANSSLKKEIFERLQH